MKEYKIKVENRMSRREIIEMWDLDEFPEEEIGKRCKEVFDLVGVHTITTFEEYYNLVKRIEEVTEENYRIYDFGTYILLFVN